jgi:hypothetical protein
MKEDENLRKHVLNLLSGRGAHLTFESAFEGFPEELLGKRVPNLPHTAWHLVEHMRIAQWDILEFSRDPAHVSPDYPGGYWPQTDGPSEGGAWAKSVKSFFEDLEGMKALISDPKQDLFAVFPHGTGQTLLREALVLADHNSYHLGQWVGICKLLGVHIND